MMITDPDEFFIRGCGRCDRFDTPDCATRIWREGLQVLRTICLDMGLEETAKWGQPCYMHGARNISLLSAFRSDYRLAFFNPALMRDPADVLEPAGPNSRHPSILRFTANDAPGRMESVLRAYLAEAMDYAARGIRPPRDESEPDLPDELCDVLDADPELAEAFRALTPGRRRSYVIALASAKQAETRLKRIAQFRERILAGKGANER